MMVQNDQEFRQVLSDFSIEDQRILAAQFIESVIHLNQDPLIESALKLAKQKMHSSDDFVETYKSIKSLAVTTYTACGNDADWSAQAAHFIASATKVCLMPLEQLGDKKNLAWKCAMQARMAKNCEMIESDSNIIDNEAQKQYDITNKFIKP